MTDDAKRRFLAQLRGCGAFEPVFVIDVGCSGGISPVWQPLGAGLRAVGIDPNIDECRRLQAQETRPLVEYVPAFVGVSAEDAAALGRGARSPWSRNPWDRLSVVTAIAHRDANAPPLETEELTRQNLWERTALADPDRPVTLAGLTAERGVAEVDFIKIDIDGPDFAVLHALRGKLGEWGVLGVQVEVNYFGSDDPTDHSFHNMDRLLRGCGFDLFDLTVRKYSHAALPAPFLEGVAGPSSFGRPLQGDALYLRDFGAAGPESGAMAPAKLLRLVAIAMLHDLWDFAAAMLEVAARKIPGIEIGGMLDLLAGMAQSGAAAPLTHAAYMAAFAEETARAPGEGARFFHAARRAGEMAEAAAALRVEREALAAERDGLAARVRALEREVAGLLGSRSFRWTAPLRRLARHARGG
jgi:hypothetical protein